MSRADEKFQRGVERVDHPHVGRQQARVGDGTERGVDVARFDGGDRHAWVVDSEGHHVEMGFGMRLPVLVQNNGLRASQAENIDPKGPGARPDRGDGALDSRDDAPCVGKECLTVERHLNPSCGTCEQAHFQRALQRGDPLGDRLLCHAQLIGRLLEPSELGRPDERSQSLGVHWSIVGWPNQSLWLAEDRLSDRPCVAVVLHMSEPSVVVRRRGAARVVSWSVQCEWGRARQLAG